MTSRRVLTGALAFLLTASGFFVVAFTTVVKVAQDPRRTEFVEQGGDSALAAVIMAGLLIGTGVMLAVSLLSPARGVGRRVAQVSGGASIMFLVMVHLKLYINAAAVATDVGPLLVGFTASYFFHTGSGYTFPAVYVIFLVTTVLLGALVASVAYLLSPDRFRRTFLEGPWAATESIVVTVSLFIVLSLVVFLVSLVRMAVDADVGEGARASGFLADTSVALHYLMAVLLGLLVLTIATRVLLVNWGTGGAFGRAAVLDTLGNVGRIERVLLGAVVLVDLAILAGPPIVGRGYLSQDPVFGLTSNMLQVFLLLILVPYAVYALGLRRLRVLLERGEGPARGHAPFGGASVLMVGSHLGGILALTVIFGAMAGRGPVDALGWLLAYAAYTTLIFLLFGVRFSLSGGFPHPRFRELSQAGPLFGFLIMALATSLMLWGAGNTFVATYYGETDTMTVENDSYWGADVLARLAATLLAALAVIVALGVLKDVAGVRAPTVGHYVAILLAMVLGALIVFTVNVWSAARADPSADALAGFSFHQYGTAEAVLSGIVLFVALAVLHVAIGRILGTAARRGTWVRSTRTIQ